MIITLKGADFSQSNIGTLSTYSIRFDSNGVTNTNTSVDRETNTGYTATITFKENYELDGSITVTMGGTDITSTAVSGHTITITKVTGNVVIKVPVKSTVVQPETPTMYTFTINPTPTSATVTLTASGYTQNGNSITVPNGTKVNWSVSASGYIEQKGTWTANGKDETLPVVLTATGSGGTGGDTSNLLTENPYFATTGMPTQMTNSSYGTKIGYDYGGFICKGIKSASTGEGNSFNVYAGAKGSNGLIESDEKVGTFTYTKEKGIEEEFLFNSPIDLTGDIRLTCNGSFMWRQSTTEEQNNPPQGVGRLQTNTPLYYYWYIF